MELKLVKPELKILSPFGGLKDLGDENFHVDSGVLKALDFNW